VRKLLKRRPEDFLACEVKDGVQVEQVRFNRDEEEEDHVQYDCSCVFQRENGHDARVADPHSDQNQEAESKLCYVVDNSYWRTGQSGDQGDRAY